MTVDTYQEKSRVSSLDHHSTDKTCTHPQVLGEQCQDCRQHVGADYGIAFDYILKGLRLSHDEVTRLRDVESKSLFTQKKLHLVLDIDHTLLHTVASEELTSKEIAYLKENGKSLLEQGCLFAPESSGFLVKLRPFVRTFLKEASSMFEMYLYTMGRRSYAMEIARLLDPEGTYFGHRIIAREDCPGFKTLDLVLGHECAVVILDDSTDAWPEDRENLILMEKYQYFAISDNPQRYSETGTDESESSGALANILSVLKEIHKLYFDHQLNVESRNVGLLMKSRRSSILNGCTLYFDEVDHEKVSHLSPEVIRICTMAMELGSKCSMERNSSVTHLVSFDERMEDICWAVQEKKFLVTPQWIEAAYYSWQRQPEEEFSIEDIISLIF